MKIVPGTEHVREQILPGAEPVGGISIGSFVRGAGCGSPTGVTAHSSSATAGANQDHRAGANQDHNPERLWRQRGVVGAAPQERDGGASFEMRVARVSAGGVGSVTLLVCSAMQCAACMQVAQI